jgi:uncharacterized membrane protein YedE/YeeE
LTANKSVITSVLENPLLTFGLITFGAFFSAFIFKEFSLKFPLTYEPFIFAIFGGFLMGFGAVVASMSTHSVVLFNLAGIFTLTAFMVTKGWLYAIFMVCGGFIGSKLLVFFTLRSRSLKKEINFGHSQYLLTVKYIFFYFSLAAFIIFMLAVILFSRLALHERIGLVVTFLFLIIFGMVTERGTICMSSMLKEWFISHSSYIWRNVLFTIMLLALMYQLGLLFNLYGPVSVEKYISNPLLLMLGSFLMGVGFIFADGCFIGSLWKAGQGNVINMIGIAAMLLGIFSAQILFNNATLKNTITASGGIPNSLTALIKPLWFIMLLWFLGVLLLVVFKPKYYNY